MIARAKIESWRLGHRIRLDLHGNDESITESVSGPDNFLLPIAERLTQAADALGENRFAQHPAGPHIRQQLFLGADLIRVLQEINEDLERFAFEVHGGLIDEE